MAQTFPTSSRLASLAGPVANGALGSSPTRPPHPPPKRINGRADPHATATTIRPQEGKNATAARPQRPATGATACPFPPGCLLPVGRNKTRGPHQARRRRPVAAAPPHCLRHRPHVAARPSPHAAATFQHGHGDER